MVKLLRYRLHSVLFHLWGALLLALVSTSLFAKSWPAEQVRIEKFFPGANVSTASGPYHVRTLTSNGKPVGYAFQTIDAVNIPAYSGKPINMQVLLDPKGTIVDAWVLEHHEPILLVGIPEQKLHDFDARYKGVSAQQRVVVGHSSDPDAVTVDAITGATVTSMVVNEIVMHAAHKVALSLGLVQEKSDARSKPAQVRKDAYEDLDWTTLTGNGAIRRLHLDREQIDEAFKGTQAQDTGNATAAQKKDTFIDLYVTHLNPPTIGRNLLGEKQYNELMQALKPGEQAIAVLGNGEYSFKGSGYVRGGIFDRVQLRQFGDTISFRDRDYDRLADVYARGMPQFREMAIFTVRAGAAFDPGAPWSLELLVRRQIGPIKSVFTSFELPYQLPEQYLKRPAPEVKAAPLPLWAKIWQQRSVQIGIVGFALLLLTAILFFQDKLTRRPVLLRWLRRGYLLFTVTYLGWYTLGQLSVVNVLTFLHALFEDFSWQLFLSDPIIFILWVFTAATLLLWGRGIFCGWLCPFGALQELLNEAARKMKIRQFEVPFAVHERLWAIKYLILLALFGLSLSSMQLAERAAEIEPFKTAIIMKFDRQWWFALYAVLLLASNLITRKVYCRYICPLGAALAIPGRLRQFDWLRRRKECGNPCHLCAKQCEIQAIHPDGRINASECHHCLDCQITWHDERRCLPLVTKNKRGKRGQAVAEQIPVTSIAP